MVLPPAFAFTSTGLATGIRHAVEVYGRPIVLYLKDERILDLEHVRRLVDDHLVSWIKYAVVRRDPRQDEYLRQLVQLVDPHRIISGIGEQPAIIHYRDFGLAGYTSGCVCVAPQLSMQMLAAMREGKFERAEEIRQLFAPLEDLRNAISPIRVLHEAVRLAAIAETGPLLPHFSGVTSEQSSAIQAAATALRQTDGVTVGNR
jgi:dihydrodipicolinate synthase/N-acetylneuraminate lyase